jgi:hypothetical protein
MQAQLTTKPLQQVIAAIQALDLDPIKLKLMDLEEGQGWSCEYADRMELAYKRFLTLLVTHPEETLAPCKDVDKFWHGHILDTLKYADDCDRVFGRFLHHFPYFGMRGAEDAANLAKAAENTRRLYRQEFGTTQTGAALCGAAVRTEAAALCGAAVRTEAAALCGVAVRTEGAALCGAAVRTEAAALCGVAVRTEGAALCGAAVRTEGAALCGVAVRTEGAALCGAAVRTEGAALCGAAVRTEGAALCGVAVRTEGAALCGVAVRTEGAALCGAAVRTEGAALCGAAVRTGTLVANDSGKASPMPT